MRYRKGVTLIELLVVIVILGALVAIAIPRIAQNTKTANRNACHTNIAVINTQLELYAANNNGTYATDITDVTDDPCYFPDGPPQCPFDDSNYTLGSNNRVSTSGHTHP